jgi:two-component system sensor kinase FixL
MSLFETCAPRSIADCSYCLMRAPEKRLRLVALSALTWTLAHEISQPLTAAMNYIRVGARQLRRQGPEFANIAAMIEDAGKEAAQAAEIVGRMRSFIAHGKVAARRENLRKMILSASRPLGSRGCADVEIVTDIDPDANCVIADRIQIEQAFSILFLNACEALADCSVRRITVSACRRAEEVIILIADTGPGLSDYVAPRVFEPLFTTKAAGMGLGLPICRTILEAHGGRLWVEKATSGGATFGMSLAAGG